MSRDAQAIKGPQRSKKRSLNLAKRRALAAAQALGAEREVPECSRCPYPNQSEHHKNKLDINHEKSQDRRRKRTAVSAVTMAASMETSMPKVKQ